MPEGMVQVQLWGLVSGSGPGLGSGPLSGLGGGLLVRV